MAGIEFVSECFVKPKYEVEAAKHPYHLSPVGVGMLSIHPIQKGLLFTINSPPHNSGRTQIVSNLLDNLKNSLSIALFHFYPLAGRFVTQKFADEQASSVFIDCAKGPGARLIHATALHATVSHIVDDEDVPTLLVQSLFEMGERSVNYDGHTRALVSIQVTELRDGVFIGFTMNHSAVDGTSFIHFVSMLSQIYRSQEISRVPVFNYKFWTDTDDDPRAVLKLPTPEPEELIQRGFDPGPLRERIFHFSPTAMADLKARATQECGAGNNVTISAYQALCGFVWRSIIRARKLHPDQPTTCSMLMNARSKLDPPVSDDYFGDFIGLANGNCTVEELLTHELGWAALHLKKAIMEQDSKAVLGFYKSIADSPMVTQPGEKEDLHGSNKVIIGGSARFDMCGRVGLSLGWAVLLQLAWALQIKRMGRSLQTPGVKEVGVWSWRSV